jgi:hypothetical protein
LRDGLNALNSIAANQQATSLLSFGDPGAVAPAPAPAAAPAPDTGAAPTDQQPFPGVYPTYNYNDAAYQASLGRY